MLSEVLAYLKGRLELAGVPTARISDDPGGAAEWPPPSVPAAELAPELERLQRVGRPSTRSYDPGTGKATLWTRLFERTLPVRVRIVDQDAASLDTLVTAFLATLERRFAVVAGDQWVRVAPRTVKWTIEGLPRDRRQAEITIEFLGGVYASAIGDTLQDPPGVKTPTVDMA